MLDVEHQDEHVHWDHTGKMRLILSVLEPAQFQELFLVAKDLADRGHTIAMHFPKQRFAQLEACTKQLIAAGFPWFDHEGNEQSGAAVTVLPAKHADVTATTRPEMSSLAVAQAPPKLRILFLMLIPIALAAMLIWQMVAAVFSVLRSFVGEVREIYQAYAQARRFEQRYKRMLDTWNADAILVCDDPPASRHNWLARAARSRGIPMVIISNVSITDWIQSYRSLERNSSLQVTSSISNRIASALFPRWRQLSPRGNLLRTPGPRIFVSEALGTSPPHPWMFASSRDALLLVPNEASRKFCKTYGFAKSRVVVTGLPTDDRLAAAGIKRAELRELISPGIGDTTPIVLASWPANQIGRIPSLDGFETFDALSDAWAKALQEACNRHGAKLLVSLHPKLSKSMIPALERNGVDVADRRLMEILPACDVFVAAMSNTIYSALACGIPVVNHDLYGKSQYSFPDAHGYIEVKFLPEFAAALDTTLANWNTTTTTSKEAMLSAAHWGILDGRASERIEQAIRQEIRDGKAHHA